MPDEGDDGAAIIIYYLGYIYKCIKIWFQNFTEKFRMNDNISSLCQTVNSKGNFGLLAPCAVVGSQIYKEIRFFISLFKKVYKN